MSKGVNTSEDYEDYQRHEKPVKTLMHNGIPAGDIKKLEEAGFVTVESVVDAPKQVVMAMAGIDEGTTDKIVQEATKIIVIGWRTAAEAHMTRATMKLQLETLKKWKKLCFTRQKKVVIKMAEINEGKTGKILQKATKILV